MAKIMDSIETMYREAHRRVLGKRAAIATTGSLTVTLKDTTDLQDCLAWEARARLWQDIVEGMPPTAAPAEAHIARLVEHRERIKEQARLLMPLLEAFKEDPDVMPLYLLKRASLSSMREVCQELDRLIANHQRALDKEAAQP